MIPMLFAQENNLKQMLEELTKEIEKLCQWFRSNKLSINLEKTKFIISGSEKCNTEIQLGWSINREGLTD